LLETVDADPYDGLGLSPLLAKGVTALSRVG